MGSDSYEPTIATGWFYLNSSLTCSNLKQWNQSGIVTRSVISANVLPRQTLTPPRKGELAKTFLLPPSGLRYQGLAGSKRSGLYKSGYFHWSGSCAEYWRPIQKASSLRSVTPSTFVSLIMHAVAEENMG